jgi:ribosomal protein S18 acetylase RimI-like enzyme
MVITELDQARIYKFHNIFTELMLEGYGNFPPYLSQYFLDNDYRVENFIYWYNNNIRKIFIALDHNDIVGFLVGDYTYGGVGYISWLGILQNYRKQGLGQKLFEQYETFAKTKKAHLIELNTFEHNIVFYNKLGFTEVGRRVEGYFGRKNIIMNKTIDKWDPNYLLQTK